MSDLISVFDHVKPAVCAIAARLGDDPDDLRVIGSGFNVDPRGIVVTCRHILEGFLLEHPEFSNPLPGQRPGFPKPTADQKRGEFRKTQLKAHPPVAVFTLVRDGGIAQVESPIYLTTGRHAHDLAVCRVRGLKEGALPHLNLAARGEVRK